MANDANVCKTVYAYKQFSWTLSKKAKFDAHSLAIAKIAVEGQHPLYDFDATHFHTIKVKPTWRNKLKRITRIGNHIFYKNEA